MASPELMKAFSAIYEDIVRDIVKHENVDEATARNIARHCLLEALRRVKLAKKEA